MKNSVKVNKFVKNLLSDLQDRQKDVLTGRYGLSGKPALTLAEIGLKYGITRERVRQIEALALNVIHPKLENGEINELLVSALNVIKKFGGIRKENLLLNDLDCSKEDASQITFLLDAYNKCRHSKEDKDFYSYWYINNDSKSAALNLIKKLKKQLDDRKAEVLEKKNLPENLQDQVSANYISISKDFGLNPFGDFGLTEWPEILPKNAKDWAYLVLKKNQKPLHFSDISKEIRKYRKEERETNTQTVHNELIKDERFVLVGRGTYGLNEFGILSGTAKEVIRHFLEKHGPLKSREIVKLVLQERTFKENTILLNLQSKKHFKRSDDGHYTLV